MVIGEQFLVIFESCRLVKGYTKTLLCDIQRNSFRFIPNDLYELLINSKGKSLKEIKAMYGQKYDNIISENLSLLEQEEFIFLQSIQNGFLT
jgi:hypothetical protein